jgi:cation:H+ antiporter
MPLSASTPSRCAPFTYEQQHREEYADETAERYARMTLRAAVLRYALGGVVIVGAGTWLPFVADRLADVVGWGTSFVGTLFVAAATSLPELVVTISAVRIGAIDMAIVGIDDLLYRKGRSCRRYRRSTASRRCRRW